MTSLYPSRLNARMEAIRITVLRFRQMRSQHITRLFFADNSPRSRETRMQRTMLRLYKRGFLGRLERDIGMGGGGSNGYVYQSPTATRSTPSAHTLAVVELYVRLKETERRKECQIVEFHVEEEAYYKVGTSQLRPDGYLKVLVGNRIIHWHIEVDRATESRGKDTSKIRMYREALDQWDQEKDGRYFPKVMYVVPDEHRMSVIRKRIREQRAEEFVEVCLSEDAISHLIGAR